MEEPVETPKSRGRPPKDPTKKAEKKVVSKKRTRSASSSPKKATKAKTQPKSPKKKAKKEYTVEKIVDEKTTTKGKEYLVKWVGYASNRNTWEPKENLTHCDQALQEFKASQKDGTAPPNKKQKSPSKNVKSSPQKSKGKAKKSADSKKKNSNEEVRNKSDLFVVESIIDKKEGEDGVRYLVKWKGYEESDNTWEPYENVAHCVSKIKEFDQAKAKETS